MSGCCLVVLLLLIPGIITSMICLESIVVQWWPMLPTISSPTN